MGFIYKLILVLIALGIPASRVTSIVFITIFVIMVGIFYNLYLLIN
jgi:hypothetical protein